MQTRYFVILTGLALFSTDCGSDLISTFTQHSNAMVSSLWFEANDAVEGEPWQLRQQKCQKEEGTWIEKLTVSPCENGVATLVLDEIESTQMCASGDGDTFEGMCAHLDEDGLVYFNDGPTVPGWILTFSGLFGDDIDQMPYISLFWSSGVAHDYCYHHNPATRGLTQTQCDENLLDDLSAVCSVSEHGDYDWFNKDTCDTYAAIMYVAVQLGGKASYDVLNSRVNYPVYEPLWKTFGLSEPVVDVELKKKIDEILQKFQ